jgi:hypothetical protein
LNLFDAHASDADGGGFDFDKHHTFGSRYLDLASIIFFAFGGLNQIVMTRAGPLGNQVSSREGLLE